MSLRSIFKSLLPMFSRKLEISGIEPKIKR